LAIAPIGFEGIGVIVAGARAADFPTETQRLLLMTAANKAALGLHGWQSETEMQRFVALIESSSDFVGYADLDGAARYVNPAGMRLVGLHSQEEVRELQVLDFLATEDRARARDEAWPIVKRSGRWAGELTFRHFTTGAGIPVLVDWFRIDDTRTGGSLNIAAVARDLRPQKKSESELRHLNETLENRVVQRTAELADAHKELLTEMSEHKRLESRLREAHLELGHAARLSSAGQIAAALAHELNQPLTAITNSLGAAKRLLARGSFIENDLATTAMDEAVQQSLRARAGRQPIAQLSDPRRDGNPLRKCLGDGG
jgi:PAS domain S-box-containing protein